MIAHIKSDILKGREDLREEWKTSGEERRVTRFIGQSSRIDENMVVKKFNDPSEV